MIRRIMAIILFLSLTFDGRADEGMWLPLLISRLNHTDIQKYGLQLTPEEIYSVNQSSLKDAIVSFGGFCSGEIISDEGLLLTNHHCGFSSIQAHSTEENNLLSNGFWAMGRNDELPNQQLYARFLIRMEDVTDRVLSRLNSKMTEDERAEAIARISKTIAREEKGFTHYDVVVKEFFSGNEFYLFVYETFTDVRLVGTPPESIGKFGGDVDAWVWPRHTGDFALFRVYSGPDGKPAPYSENNVPLVPKHHLPISLQGVQEGDFTMVMGYPGSTDRYLTSFGVQQALDQTNPVRLKIREKRLGILKEAMSGSEEVRLKYSAKYASISNFWKYFSGQATGLQKKHVLEEKQALENEFEVWATANEQRNQKYGKALELVQQSYDQSYETNLTYLYLMEAALGTEIIRFANSFRGLETALAQQKKYPERVKSLVESLRESTEKHFKEYHALTDRKIMAALLKMYYKEVPKKDHPPIFEIVEEKFNGDFQAWVHFVFENSIFDDEQKVLTFLDSPNLKILEKDPAYVAATSFMDNYNKRVSPRFKEINAKRELGNRLFVKGLQEMLPEKRFYPNANSTMRISFGKVMGYEVRDAIQYKFYTTLEGVMQKEDSARSEYFVPKKLAELYQQKDYGPYDNQKGELVVAFITNNDITGGNSGSPVLDSKGRLLGTAFDGNWEAMSGDFAYDPALQRCVNVDIRYILFIIDKFAGAGHLVKEMTIIGSNQAEQQDKKVSEGR